MLAGLGDGAASYRPSTLGRVVLPLQFSRVWHFLPVEVQCGDVATPERDLWPLVVRLESPCSLLRSPLVDVGPRPAIFDMLRNQQTARQSMQSPFADHNETAPEPLLGVRRSKLL